MSGIASVLLPRTAPADDPDEARLETAARLAYHTYIAQGANAALRAARQSLTLAREVGTGSPAVLAMYANTLAVVRGLRAGPRAQPKPDLHARCAPHRVSPGWYGYQRAASTYQGQPTHCPLPVRIQP